jgi:hypothetical protein
MSKPVLVRTPGGVYIADSGLDRCDACGGVAAANLLPVSGPVHRLRLEEVQLPERPAELSYVEETDSYACDACT